MAQTIKFKKQHKKYSGYKDSGGEWSKDIPNSWLIDKLQHISTLRREKTSVESTSSNYLALENIESFTGKYIESEIEQEPESVTNEFRKGDVLFNKLRPYLAKVFLPDSDGICTGELLVIHPLDNKLIPKFLFYRFLSDDFLSTVNNSTYGAKMPRASWEFIRNILIGYPNKEDQKTIASYLDQKTTLIDQIIEKKRKLIDLLKEKRAAVINQAVTRGLDPEAKLVDSGVEWIGKVPEGWALKPIKRVAKIYGRIGFRGYTTEDIVGPEEGAVTLSPSNIVEDKLNLDSLVFISWQKYDESPEIKINKQDVIFVKTGSTIGKAAYCDSIEMKMTINPQLVVFKNIQVNSKYLYYSLVSECIRSQVYSEVTGGSTPALNQAKIGAYVLVVPLPDEQAKIAEYLDNATSAIDAITQKVERSINLLKEHKSSLISNVVTGKVEV